MSGRLREGRLEEMIDSTESASSAIGMNITLQIGTSRGESFRVDVHQLVQLQTADSTDGTYRCTVCGNTGSIYHMCLMKQKAELMS